MFRKRTMVVGSVVAMLALAGFVAPASSSSLRVQGHAARHYTTFQGRITSWNRSRGWFWMRTTTNRTVRIYTNRGSRWYGCNWGSMRHRHNFQVRVYRSNGRWVASGVYNWNSHGWSWSGQGWHHGGMMGGPGMGGWGW